MWNKENEAMLKQLTIDPSRHSQEKLIKMFEHFKAGGSVHGVVNAGEPVHVSAVFAEKFRELVQRGELEWLVASAQDSKDAELVDSG